MKRVMRKFFLTNQDDNHGEFQLTIKKQIIDR